MFLSDILYTLLWRVINFRYMILITNYKTGLRSEPIQNVMPGKRIKFNKEAMEIEINESVSIGVFDEVPYMRNIAANKAWFEGNIYHLH